MMRILAAIVGGEAAAWKWIEPCDQHLAGVMSRLAGQRRENGEAAEAIHQDIHRLLPSKEQRIALPVADLSPLIGGRWTGVDEQTACNRAGLHPTPRAPAALLLAPAQILVELLCRPNGDS